MSSASEKKDNEPIREEAWAIAEDNPHVQVHVNEQDVPDYYLTGIIPRQTSQEASEDPNFVPISSKAGEPRLPKHDDDLRKRRQDASEFRYEVDPNYRGVIDSFLFFIIGTGFQVRSEDEDPRVQEYLERFMRASEFESRDQDVIIKALRA